MPRHTKRRKKYGGSPSLLKSEHALIMNSPTKESLKRNIEGAQTKADVLARTSPIRLSNKLNKYSSNIGKLGESEVPLEQDKKDALKYFRSLSSYPIQNTPYKRTIKNSYKAETPSYKVAMPPSSPKSYKVATPSSPKSYKVATPSSSPKSYKVATPSSSPKSYKVAMPSSSPKSYKVATPSSPKSYKVATPSSSPKSDKVATPKSYKVATPSSPPSDKVATQSNILLETFNKHPAVKAIKNVVNHARNQFAKTFNNMNKWLEGREPIQSGGKRKRKGTKHKGTKRKRTKRKGTKRKGTKRRGTK